MKFNETYQYLKDNINKRTMTIKELNRIICLTEQFEPTVDGYLLTDCIVSEKLCSFNSYSNNDGTKVIALDIRFKKKKDFKIIREMSWNKEEYNDMKVRVENIYLYSI